MAKKTKRADFRMKIASLIDEPGTYVGVFDMYGNLLHHEGGETKTAQEIETEELIEEFKNENQLNLFV